MSYNSSLPADTTAPAEIRENFRALKEDKIVDAATAVTADSAAKLTTARVISLTGDAAGSVAFDGSTDVAITVDVLSADTSAQCTGNAATATKLETPRNINGVAFDGSADITITAAANGGNADTVDGLHANDLIKATTPVGTVIWYAASTPPAGYLECNGSVLSASDYPELVAILGTTYGKNGQLPDLRGQFIRGWDHSRTFGSPEADAGRNISGNLYGIANIIHASADGAFANGSYLCMSNVNRGNSSSSYNYSFDASRVWGANHTANEFRPVNVTLLACIKY